MSVVYTLQKTKFPIKDFFTVWSHLLKKSLMENFIFCAVTFADCLRFHNHFKDFDDIEMAEIFASNYVKRPYLKLAMRYQREFYASTKAVVNLFCKKGVLENFARFPGKHLCQCLFFYKIADLRPATLLKNRL